MSLFACLVQSSRVISELGRSGLSPSRFGACAHLNRLGRSCTAQVLMIKVFPVVRCGRPEDGGGYSAMKN